MDKRPAPDRLPVALAGSCSEGAARAAMVRRISLFSTR